MVLAPLDDEIHSTREALPGGQFLLEMRPAGLRHGVEFRLAACLGLTPLGRELAVLLESVERRI